MSRSLARAAVEYARARGARALEGYPMITKPGQTVALVGELHVGTRSIFEAAGFAEVSHPTRRRVVMRIDFPISSRRRRAWSRAALSSALAVFIALAEPVAGEFRQAIFAATRVP